MPLKKLFVVNSANGGSLRVNVTTAVGAANIRDEVDGNGRECWVISSATLPDNVVMNEILYPAAEIEKSYKTLEGTPAPLGHPVVRGELVSATHPEAYPFLTGAINRNVKREDGRVFIEKWIDKEFAEKLHPELVEAINSKQPIHTSTGLTLVASPVANATSHKFVASNMQFDHDAILLNEVGAAKPHQGVGMFVNSTGEKVKVINSELNSEKHEILSAALPDDSWLMDFTEDAVFYSKDGEDYESAYTLKDGVATLTGEQYTVKRKTLWERVANAIKPKIFNQSKVKKMDEETKEALAGLTTAMTALTETVGAISGKVDAIEADGKAAAEAVANAQAKQDEALRKEVAEKLGETVANALSGEALKEAHAKLTANKASDLGNGLPVGNAQAGGAPDFNTYLK